MHNFCLCDNLKYSLDIDTSLIVLQFTLLFFKGEKKHVQDLTSIIELILRTPAVANSPYEGIGILMRSDAHKRPNIQQFPLMIPEK